MGHCQKVTLGIIADCKMLDLIVVRYAAKQPAKAALLKETVSTFIKHAISQAGLPCRAFHVVSNAQNFSLKKPRAVVGNRLRKQQLRKKYAKHSSDGLGKRMG
jgi:hypothetical protein